MVCTMTFAKYPEPNLRKERFIDVKIKDALHVTKDKGRYEKSESGRKCDRCENMYV
jgi:hypothetical protein